MQYMQTVESHADAIRQLPDDTRELVADALRVRAMDFVADRVDNDARADMAADVVRALVPDADEANVFDPDNYGT